MATIKSKNTKAIVPGDEYEPAGRGVAKCLVWQEPKKGKDGKKGKDKKKSSTTTPPPPKPEIVIRKKAEVGKPTPRGYVLPDEDAIPPEKGDGGGTAIQALRGWPKTQEQIEKEEEERMKAEEEAERMREEARIRQKQLRKKALAKKGDKDKGNKGIPNPDDIEEGDPIMAELIGHKYLAEYVKMRDAQKRKEEMKLLKAQQKEDEAKLILKEMRPTRASTLRTIANGPKVEVDPKDLWKMSKFTKNAQSKLETQRQSNPRKETKENTDLKEPACFPIEMSHDELPPDTDRSLRLTPVSPQSQMVECS